GPLPRARAPLPSENPAQGRPDPDHAALFSPRPEQQPRRSLPPRPRAQDPEIRGGRFRLRRRGLAPAVVPDPAVLAAPQVAPAAQDPAQQERRVLAPAVELGLATAGHDRMAMQDDETPLTLQPARQVEFLGREELFAEAACGTKGRCLA